MSQSDPNQSASRLQLSPKTGRLKHSLRQPLEEPREPAPDTLPLPRPTAPVQQDYENLLDLDSEARVALGALVKFAARRDVRLEIAVQPTLKLRMPRNSLHEALTILLVHAIEATFGGKVMLGALRQAGRIQIVVVDDGKGLSEDLQRAQLRHVEETISLVGGKLVIDSRPGQGTTISLRLPDPAGHRAA